MNIQWDPVQQEKIELVANRYQISVERAKDVVEFYLRSVTRHTRKYEPAVVVNIGLYYLDPRKSCAKILFVFKRFRAGNMTEEEFRDFLKTWLPLHRVASTHMPLTGGRYRLNMRLNGSNWGIYRKVVAGSSWGVVKTKDNGKAEKKN